MARVNTWYGIQNDSVTWHEQLQNVDMVILRSQYIYSEKSQQSDYSSLIGQ